MTEMPDDIRKAARQAALGHGIDGRDFDDICEDIGLAILAERERHNPALIAAAQAMANDYQTSETHHPDHVLVPRAEFEAMCAAIFQSNPETSVVEDGAA